MREHASWDPTAYGRFAGERSRPFADLVAQVRTDDPTAGRRPRLRPRAADADPRRALAAARGSSGSTPRESMLESARRARPRRAGRVGAVRPARVGPRLARPGPRRHRDQLDAAVGAGPPRPARRLGRGAGRRRLVRPAGAGQLRRPEPPADARDRRAPRAGRRARRRRSTCRRWGSPRPTCATCRPRLRRRRVGDDLPARARPRRRGREPGAHLGGRDRAAAGHRHPHRRGRARRVHRPVCRGARRRLPALVGRGALPVPPGVRRGPQAPDPRPDPAPTFSPDAGTFTWAPEPLGCEGERCRVRSRAVVRPCRWSGSAWTPGR